MKHAITVYILSAAAALAHPGHEAAVVEGEAHWLTQPDHMVIVALGVIASAMVLRRVITARRADPKEA